MPQSFQEKQLAAIKELEELFARGEEPSSIVPFMQDHADDQRLCLTSLAFLPGEACRKIQTQLIEPLKSQDPNQYFYLPQSLHITIQNVRTIHDPPTFTERDVQLAREAFRAASAKHKSLSFELKRIFELPTSLALCAFCDENLQLLVGDLRQSLAEAGIGDNKRYGSNSTAFGNVTVCRYTRRPNPSFLSTVAALKNTLVGAINVHEIALVTTNAVCHPNKTTVIEKFKLNSCHSRQ